MNMTQANDKKRYDKMYKGTVYSNIDPEMRGRCQVTVPEISPLPLLSFADVVFPFGGMQSGMYSSAPLPGTCVWVQFSGGDLDKPLVVGGRYESAAEVPALAQLTPPGLDHKQISTQGQNMFAISDLPGPTGGFTLQCNSGAFIRINSLGVQISCGAGIGQIMVTAAGVDINGIGPAAALSLK
jgi:hypothetical protein